MKELHGSFTQEWCLPDSSMVSPVAGSEDPHWSIPRKGLYGGHGVLENSRMVPDACSSAAWSQDIGTDSQQQLLMTTRPSAGTPRFLTGVLWRCHRGLRFSQEHLLCPMAAWALWLDSYLRQIRSQLVPCIPDCVLWSQPETLPWKGRGRKQDGKSYGREVESKWTGLCPHQQQQPAAWSFSGGSGSLSYQEKRLLPRHLAPAARRNVCMGGWARPSAYVSHAKVFTSLSCPVGGLPRAVDLGAESR